MQLLVCHFICHIQNKTHTHTWKYTQATDEIKDTKRIWSEIHSRHISPLSYDFILFRIMNRPFLLLCMQAFYIKRTKIQFAMHSWHHNTDKKDLFLFGFFCLLSNRIFYGLYVNVYKRKCLCYCTPTSRFVRENGN